MRFLLGLLCLSQCMTSCVAFRPRLIDPFQRKKLPVRTSSLLSPTMDKVLIPRHRSLFPALLPKIPARQIDTKKIWEKLTSPITIEPGTCVPLCVFLLFLVPLLVVGGLERAEQLLLVFTSLLIDIDDMAPTGQDAKFHAEILNDLSHVALDFGTIAKGPESAIAARLLVFFGRICVVMAEYLPNHSIPLDELAFQVIFLTVAWTNLVKSLHFVSVGLMPSSRKMTLRDGRAYSLLFQPAGLSWNQYKAFSSKAVDWVDLREHQTTHVMAYPVPKYLYWLYKGNVTIEEQNDNQVIAKYSIARESSRKEGIGKGLLGDLALLHFLDGKSALGKESPPHELLETRIIAGQGGATLLRIDAALLVRWIREYDENVELPLRSILLRGIREKLRS